MSTTLVNAMQELSRQLGDFWQSTTTGAGTATTLVDTALKVQANDWITDWTWAFLIEEPTGSAAIYDERKASSLDNSTGTLTTLAFDAAPGTGINYEIHRLFRPSEKRRALIAAARRIYPAAFTEIWDETIVSGNWLKDGSFERWTTSTNLTDWAENSLTATQTSTATLFKHGAYSAKLSGTASYLSQSVTEFDDLKHLQSKNVTFTVAGHSDTASSLRLAIYDGVNTTYSDYHDGDSAWTEDTAPLEVVAEIDADATTVELRIYHDVAAATEYVDDARVISGFRSRVYIGNLGLAQNRPHQVLVEPFQFSQAEPWYMVRNFSVDTDGYLYLPTGVLPDRRLRIRGLKILDFLISGVSSTLWTATIDIEQPQLEILVAQAALYLYTWVSMPNFESGQREDYQQMMGFWADELRSRKAQFRMVSPGATINFGHRR